MKKIVGIIAAAALATSAFAEINIGSWSRGSFVPFAYNGDTVKSLEGSNWNGTNATCFGVRTGLTFSADTENAGLMFQVFGNPSDEGSKLELGDQAYIYVKPVEMLKVAFGKFDNNWGRQDVCFGMWDHTWRMGGNLNEGEGVAVKRDHSSTGFEVTLQPVDGLVIDYQGGFGGGYDKYSYKIEKAAIDTSYAIGDINDDEYDAAVDGQGI